MVNKGKPLRLLCQSADATVTWYKDDEPLDEDGMVDSLSGQLVIGSVDNSHLGKYECKASNELGTASGKITVTSGR